MKKNPITEGKRMHALARRLFPICRSITGEGVRKTLRILQENIPLAIREVRSGTRVFDWTIPKEWNITDAYVLDPSGKKVIDFKKNTLHVVGYSTAVDREMPLEELQEHLYSLPDQPDAVPYVTSYYKERWGFCIADVQRRRLRKGMYRVVIQSELRRGSLSYGELIIKGRSKKEVLISTYICHPSMANNELSGPVVVTALAKWLGTKKRRYTYRIVFVPETIGSLAYMAKNLPAMKKNIIAGFNVTCVGDERAYSYMPSRHGDTLADLILLRVLKRRHPSFKTYSFLERGSDESQYCAPGADLPVASLMRSKYGEYPEYHTSLDDLKLVTPKGLQGSLDVLRECIEDLEGSPRYRTTTVGEPQLGKRGLYPTLSKRSDLNEQVMILRHVLAFSDGTRDARALSELMGVPKQKVEKAIKLLVARKLLVADA